jgi:hypothetical protein
MDESASLSASGDDSTSPEKLRGSTREEPALSLASRRRNYRCGWKDRWATPPRQVCADENGRQDSGVVGATLDELAPSITQRLA